MFLPSRCCSFLCLYLCPSFVLTLAFHKRVDFLWRGVVPVRYAPLTVRLMRRFSFESIVPSQPRRVQTNVV